jgi:hypothetical protein
VKALTKAIEAGSRTKIFVELKRNNTLQFIITGGPRSVDKAFNDVIDEFEEVINYPRSKLASWINTLTLT